MIKANNNGRVHNCKLIYRIASHHSKKYSIATFWKRPQYPPNIWASKTDLAVELNPHGKDVTVRTGNNQGQDTNNRPRICTREIRATIGRVLLHTKPYYCVICTTKYTTSEKHPYLSFRRQLQQICQPALEQQLVVESH